jgi:GT2 family glycosyltransferase
VLDRIGWFDERFFMYCEDVDLCRRIKDDGSQLYYLSEAAVVHLVAGASKQTSSHFSTLMQRESVLHLMSKYYGRWGGISYRAGIFVGASVRLLAGCLLACAVKTVTLGRQSGPRGSLSKYTAMWLWSLGFRRPTITQ